MDGCQHTPTRELQVARGFHDLCNALWAIEIESTFAASAEAGSAETSLGLEEIRRQAQVAMESLRVVTALQGLTVLGRALGTVIATAKGSGAPRPGGRPTWVRPSASGTGPDWMGSWE